MSAQSLALGLLLLASPAAGTAEAPAARPAPSYDLRYEARIQPSARAARVAIRITQGAGEVRVVRLRIDPERHREFGADGRLVVRGEHVEWHPPRSGGTLRYVFRIDHLLDERSYDARCAESWALFRGDDLVPPARVRTLVGAQARARLRLRLPEGWSAVTPYPRLRDGSFAIEVPGRGFDRPVGWILVGRLGVLREKVAGVRVTVAAPVSQGLRRLDTLALLRWTLPELRDILGELPERLLVVGGGDPLWRGGLSGPGSIYLHASRPLISADTTSPLLHELIHVTAARGAAPNDDWLVEGLAELYGLELLVRSRTISRARYQRALERLAARGRGARLRSERSDGAVTARAVTVLRALDGELRGPGGGGPGLDAVLRRLAAEGSPLSTARLREASEEVAGRSLEEFFRRRIPSPRPRTEEGS